MSVNVPAGVVGRRAEHEAVTAALEAGLDVLLEGPPGTSKSTLLRAIAAQLHRPLFLVEGNANLTPARLAGWHDPPAVMAHGYRDEDFVAGPLVEAMRSGGLLYLEELNRVPADTLNLLLGPLSERRLAVPRLGEVHAGDGFRLVAAMNPHDDVGAAAISRAVLDRLVRLVVDHQPASEEQAVVREHTGSANRWLIEGAVAVGRATRVHPELEYGASVRGAIDLVAVAERLAAHEGVGLEAGTGEGVVLRAALLALSGRVRAPVAGRPAEVVLEEIFQDVFLLAPARAERGEHALDVDNPIQLRSDEPKGRMRQVPAREIDRPDVPDQVAWPRAGDVQAPPTVLQAADVDAALGAGRGTGRTVDVDLPEESHDELADLGGEGRSGADLDDEEDPEALYERARRLAREILLRLPRTTVTPAAGRGKLTSIRYRFNSDDLDLDRTLEEIAGNPFPEAQDFWVYERVRTRRAYALMLDVSGSMRGSQLVHAAVAAGALATAIERDDLAVVAFWRDAAVLEPLSRDVDTERLLRRVLALSARGLTNLHLGLELGLTELAGSSSQDRVGILFSDAGHNLGADPLEIAGRFDVLHVVGTSTEASRVRACHDVAARGGGRCVFASALEEIPAAINACIGA